MRTFEEVRELIKTGRESIISRTQSDLETRELESYEIKGHNMLIQECQSDIENIEEVTTIEIGSATNRLIKEIQKAHSFYSYEYYTNFKKFLYDHVLGLTPEGNPKNGMFFGQGECITLGIDANDLSCFEGHNPNSEETVDLFKQVVNTNMGTNIPLHGVEEAALDNYDEVMFSDDEDIKAKALCHLREIQRDSGTLKSGSLYHKLANDQRYQNAKMLCSGKNL